jgi:hypothetical protein
MRRRTLTVVEEYSFLIQGFHMQHAAAEVVLDIRVRYKYPAGILPAEYPDFREIAETIKAYLAGYPNKDEYWEVINKELVLMVIGKYQALESLTSELEMRPSKTDPDFNSSKVTCHR